MLADRKMLTKTNSTVMDEIAHKEPRHSMFAGQYLEQGEEQ